MRQCISKSTIVIIAIATCALIYFWLSDSPNKILGVDITSKSKSKNAPFAVAQNASTKHYTKDGGVDYEFFAKKLEHFKTSESDEDATAFATYTLITEPLVTIFQDESPWIIQAQNGKLLSDGSTLELWDSVSITQSDPQGIMTTQLNTSKLTIEPEKKLAQTDESVTIVSPKGKITGVGMQADLGNKTIKILSKVRGIHVPI